MTTFKRTLQELREIELNYLMDRHDAELRQVLSSINVDELRVELFRQAVELLPEVRVVHTLDMYDFCCRHERYLLAKNAWEDSHGFYSSYPDVVLFLEKLRAEFTDMNVSIQCFTSLFEITIAGCLTPTE